jgi:hypothetical protein
MRLADYARRSLARVVAALRRPPIPDGDGNDAEGRNLRWKDVREDWEHDGPELREIYVFDTSVDDWQRLREVIASRWESSFYFEDKPMPMPTSMGELFERMDSEGVTSWWYIQAHEDVEIRSIIHWHDDVRFDLNAGHVVGQPHLDAVCEFVRVIGTALERSVLVCAEGLPRGEADALENAIMRYDLATDAFVRIPPPEPKSLFERWDEERRRSN